MAAMRHRPVGMDPRSSEEPAKLHELAISEKGEAYTLTERRIKLTPVSRPFLNDTFGQAINQNIAFGGTPEIITNGGTSAEWQGAVIQGNWSNVAGKLRLASGVDLDQVTFAEETPAEIDMTNFTALTGKVNLITYVPTDSIIFAYDLAGVLVGNSINLNDYINTGLLNSEQSFAIPKAELGISTENVDGFSIVALRPSGPQMLIDFDDIQIEATGDPAEYRVSAELMPLHITELRLALVDAIAGTLADGTMPALSYDQILGVAALSRGVTYKRVQNGVTQFSVQLKQLSDFIAAGTDLVNQHSDGVDTFIGLVATLREPIILEGYPSGNFLSFTNTENLSGLKLFTATARGAIEI